MDRFGPGGVELTVGYTSAGAHALDFPRPNDGARTHAVLMFESPFENVGDDFHITMRMRSKPFTRRDTIFVDDAQSAKTHGIRIVITIEREGVIRVQPS